MTTLHTFPILKIAAAAAVLALAPAMAASPAAATTDAQASSAHHVRHHARAHVRQSYARVYVSTPWVDDEWVAYRYHPYHCGIGVFNTPLACEAGD